MGFISKNIMKNKILIFSSSFKFYKNFIEPIEKILSQNHDIYILTNFGVLNKSLIKKNYFNIKISRKLNLFQDFIGLFQILFHCLLINPKLIITTTPKGAIVGIFLKSIFFWKKRIHVYTGTTWYNKKGFKKNCLKFIDQINFYFSNELFFDGLNQIKIFKKYNFGTKTCKLISKGSIKGVDTNKFISKKDLYDNFRLENSLNPSDKILLYMGRIEKEKGIIFLIECFVQLLSNNKNIILVLCGSSEMDIHKIIKNEYYEYSNRIIIIEHTDKPEKIFQAADILCIPSEREGFGNVVIEASSCQVPVIGSDISGLDDSLIHNMNGLRYKLFDKQNFIKNISKLLDDNDLRILLGKNGRKFVLENFNEKKVLNDFSKMIELNL